MSILNKQNKKCLFGTKQEQKTQWECATTLQFTEYQWTTGGSRNALETTLTWTCPEGLILFAVDALIWRSACALSADRSGCIRKHPKRIVKMVEGLTCDFLDASAASSEEFKSHKARLGRLEGTFFAHVALFPWNLISMDWIYLHFRLLHQWICGPCRRKKKNHSLSLICYCCSGPLRLYFARVS